MPSHFLGAVTLGVEGGEPKMVVQFATGGYCAEFPLPPEEVADLMTECWKFLNNHYPHMTQKGPPK